MNKRFFLITNLLMTVLLFTSCSLFDFDTKKAGIYSAQDPSILTCVDTSDCGAGKVCTNNVCIDALCGSTTLAYGLTCSQSLNCCNSGVCISGLNKCGCLDSLDCPISGQVCNTQTNTCSFQGNTCTNPTLSYGDICDNNSCCVSGLCMSGTCHCGNSTDCSPGETCSVNNECTPTNPIYLYAADQGGASVAMSGDGSPLVTPPATRQKLDAACTNTGHPTTCSNVKAFISFNATDSIQNLSNIPAATPVKSFTGITIASSWSNLLTADLEVELQSATVSWGGAGQFWSGTKIGGGNTVSCSGWTSNNLATTGTYGSQLTTEAATWIGVTTTAACSETKYLLCVCW